MWVNKASWCFIMINYISQECSCRLIYDDQLYESRVFMWVNKASWCFIMINYMSQGCSCGLIKLLGAL